MKLLFIHTSLHVHVAGFWWFSDKIVLINVPTCLQRITLVLACVCCHNTVFVFLHSNLAFSVNS